MIPYSSGAYGLGILFRFHGSAAYKSLTPAVLSTGVYLAFFHTLNFQHAEIADHPYPFTALIVAFTFLLTFKANFSYNRYWEAVTAVHHMHSKWLDGGMDICSFHLQSSIYEKKPPAYGAHPHVMISKHNRGKMFEPPSRDDLADQIDNHLEQTGNSSSLRCTFERIKSMKSIARFTSSRKKGKTGMRRPASPDEKKSIRGSYVPKRLPTPINPVDPRTSRPSPFLQEAAHLLSLLSAVAMSTLRNDVEAAESPLATFSRGAPWPAVDPDAKDADIRLDWSTTSHHLQTTLKYLFGLTRTDKDRTLYNAARPFRVIGGVSDQEIELLQAARGPFAKVALVSVWVQEFLSREYLQGSMGDVQPPIISRLFQHVSDGMLGYNQARKVAYIPFPFPHSQITSLFVVVVVIYIPVLMLTFTSNALFGALLNLFTVMCFAGLHEVSRELENPFQNVPNDIPLNNFQAQFNEALMNMFVGYHPDSYWIKNDLPKVSSVDSIVEESKVAVENEEKFVDDNSKVNENVSLEDDLSDDHNDED